MCQMLLQKTIIKVSTYLSIYCSFALQLNPSILNSWEKKKINIVGVQTA